MKQMILYISIYIDIDIYSIYISISIYIDIDIYI
jgi:hypothetical protein